MNRARQQLRLQELGRCWLCSPSLTAATFHRSLDVDVHATSSSASDVGHCHDHLGRDDRRLGHLGHHLDDRRRGHLGHHPDDQHPDHQTRDLDHLGDQHLGHHLDDQHLERLDALDRQYLLGHDQEHLQANDRCEHPRRHSDDQHLGQKGEGPLADGQ